MKIQEVRGRLKSIFETIAKGVDEGEFRNLDALYNAVKGRQKENGALAKIVKMIKLVKLGAQKQNPIDMLIVNCASGSDDALKTLAKVYNLS